MRIGAVIGVKDEAELIAPCIERLEAIGVEAIVVLDDNSTDGTAEVVDALAACKAGQLRRVTFAPDLKENLHRDGPALRLLIGDHAPDWILFTDADEFWLPAGEDLRAIAERTVTDALLVDRFNIPLTEVAFAPEHGADPQPFLDAPLIVERARLTLASVRDSNARWVMNTIAPKMLCRTDRFVAFEAGMHSAFASDGARLNTSVPADVVIVHAPLTTYARFERKVGNARAFFARWIKDYPGEMAWHWKHWIELKDQGKLRNEFERQRMSAEEAVRLRKSRAVVNAGDLLVERMR